MTTGARICVSVGILVLAIVMHFLVRREYREAIDLTGTAAVFLLIGFMLT